MRSARIRIAVGFSLLLHALVVAIPIAKRPGEIGALTAPQTFIARLVEAVPKKEPVAEPAPTPVVPVPKPRPVTPPRSTLPPPPPLPAVPVERPAPVEKADAAPAPQFDMLAMINARRERRREAESTQLRQQEMRDAPTQGSADPSSALNRNLQTLKAGEEGTGGVFTILYKGTRTAQFAFNGWRPDTQRRWREVIEVDAGQGGDVERAIVRRMIELIRSHYEGDFTWRSHRLSRSVVMSARREHGAELEDFLMREFFGTPTLAHQR